MKPKYTFSPESDKLMEKGAKKKMTSKTITLKWLEGYCNENKFEHKLCACGHKGDILIIHNLLAAARTQEVKDG